MPSLQSIVETLLWQLAWACWLWLSSPGMIWKTRLENSYCILELVVSILLNLMCAWTSGAECQDLTMVEGPTSKEQISQCRSSEGREALGLVGAQSNIWGLYPNTLPCDIALSPTPWACRISSGRCHCRQCTAPWACVSDPPILTVRLLVWFIFFLKNTQFPVSKGGEEG